MTIGPLLGGVEGAGYVRVPIVVEALGLSASSYLELEDWGGGKQGLMGFFMTLAASWRGWAGLGWAGEEAWHDDHAGIRFFATHDGVGTVKLRLSMMPRPIGTDIGSWKLEAALGLDAGSLDATAAAMRQLLIPEASW